MKTERTPVLLSALVYPGSGQCLQKRWISAACFMVPFTIFMSMVLFNVMKPMINNITTALNWATTGTNEEFTEISIPGILWPFLLAVIIYIANISDVVRASRRPPPKPPELPPLP